MTSLVNKGLRSSCAKSFQVHFFRTICLHRIKGSLLKMKSVQNNITQRIQIGVSHLWTHTRRWRRISVRLLLRCYVHKVMFTLYQEWSIRSCSHFVDTTKQRHRTGTSRLQTSNIVPERLIERVWVLPVPIHTPEHLLPSHWISVLFSCLFTSAMVKIPVCTTPKCGTEPNPTCYAQFWSSARHSCALLQKSRWNHPFYVWTEAISGMVFVPVQKLSDIVWTLPKKHVATDLIN